MFEVQRTVWGGVKTVKLKLSGTPARDPTSGLGFRSRGLRLRASSLGLGVVLVNVLSCRLQIMVFHIL